MSIKLMGVDAPKMLAGVADEERYTQDFIMNNYPAFFLDGDDDSYEFFKAVYEDKPASFFESAFIPGSAHNDRRRAPFDAVNIQSKIEASLNFTG